jgi:FkbM family methyltransferase
MRGGRNLADRLQRAAGAARCVTERGRFVAAELVGRPRRGVYRLRGTDFSIIVRHPLLDAWVVEEVFGRHIYDPPEPVRRRLPGPELPLRVLDLGGHIGCFGLFLLTRLPHAQITSFEADPRNAAVLRDCVELNGLQDRWRVIEQAAGVGDGEVTIQSSFHLSRVAAAEDRRLDHLQAGLGQAIPYLSSSELLRNRAARVRRCDVLPIMAEADLVKIDIEGGEQDILGDQRFLPDSVRAVVLEYHPPYLDSADPLGFILERLRAAGLETTDPTVEIDNGMIWAWRP